MQWASPPSIVAADFNGDGKLTWHREQRQRHNASVLLGNGDGTFQAQINYVTGASPSSIVTGDFNGDGKTYPGGRE